jgi:hypothetical protein
VAEEKPLKHQLPLLAVAALALALGCVAPGPGARPVTLGDLASQGDPARRASLRLVGQGLDADAAERSAQAVSHYRGALRVDPGNPYAYLAMARHYAEVDPQRALDYVDRAEMLLESEAALSPRVEPHLLGIRGTALRAAGRAREGDALVARARDLAPGVWDDGRLSAAELK